MGSTGVRDRSIARRRGGRVMEPLSPRRPHAGKTSPCRRLLCALREQARLRKLGREGKGGPELPRSRQRRPFGNPRGPDHRAPGRRHVPDDTHGPRVRRDRPGLGHPHQREHGSAGRTRHAQPRRALSFLGVPAAPRRAMHHPHTPAACLDPVHDGPAAGGRAHGRDAVPQRLRPPEGMARPAHRRPGRRDHLRGAGRQAQHPAGEPRFPGGRLLHRGSALPFRADRARGPQPASGGRRLRGGETGG